MPCLTLLRIFGQSQSCHLVFCWGPACFWAQARPTGCVSAWQLALLQAMVLAGWTRAAHQPEAASAPAADALAVSGCDRDLQTSSLWFR